MSPPTILKTPEAAPFNVSAPTVCEMSERRIVLGREARVFISSLPGEFRVRLAFASHRHVVAVGRTGDEAVKNLEQSLADKIL